MKIAAVSYINTWPFIYGLEKWGLSFPFELQLEVPSVCADLLQSEKADIALIPTGSLLQLPHYTLLSDFCIGAEGKVDSVVLLSHKQLPDIKTIHLDTDSKTSVQLVQILAEHYWHIQPEWKVYENNKTSESVVLIGDKTFEKKKEYPYCYDLAEEWTLYTKLPFVFACWVSLNQVNNSLITELNHAFSWGLDNLDKVLEEYKTPLLSKKELQDYYTKSISYSFDRQKKEGLQLFLKFLKQDKVSH